MRCFFFGAILVCLGRHLVHHRRHRRRCRHRHHHHYAFYAGYHRYHRRHRCRRRQIPKMFIDITDTILTNTANFVILGSLSVLG